MTSVTLGGAAESGCAGALDPSFASPRIGFLSAIAADGDSVVCAAGPSVVRVWPDGTLDSKFIVSAPGTASIVKDGQGGWFIGGSFTNVNLSARNGLARLRENGSVDSTFSPFSELNTPATIAHSITIRSTGIIVAAEAALNESNKVYFVAGLTSDGTKDPRFNTNAIANDLIESVNIQADGKILVGGRFTAFAGKARNQVCRLLADGSLDETFAPERAVASASGVKSLSDGKILVNCLNPFAPEIMQPAPTAGLVRLNGDGTIDRVFEEAGDSVSQVVVQGDGKYILVGRFNGRGGANRVVQRLYPSGESDPSFVSAINRDDYRWKHLVTLDSSERPIVFIPIAPFLARPKLARLLSDNSSCIPIFNFETDHLEFIEANGTVKIPIVRTGDITATASVQIAPAHYLDWIKGKPVGTNFVFGPGVTRQDITIELTENTTLEPPRRSRIVLTNCSAGSVIGSVSKVDVSILDATAQTLPGAIDQSFRLGFAPAARWAGLVVMADGKIDFGGGYVEINGTNTAPIIRANTNGTIDTTFNYTEKIAPNVLAPWQDKLYVGTSNTASPVVRLLKDGSIDPGFEMPAASARPVSYNNIELVQTLSVHADGSLLISGSFTNIGGIDCDGLARLNSDGSLDTTFHVTNGISGSEYPAVNATLILPDGTYLIAGNFRTFGGEIRQNVAHLSSQGDLLPDFEIPETIDSNGFALALARQSDGTVLVSGYFPRNNPNGTAERYLLRFTSGGAFDPALQLPSFDYWGSQVLVQPDDKIIVVSYSAIERLNADGSLDSTFYYRTPMWNAAAALDPNGSLYIRMEDAALPGLQSRILRVRADSYTGPSIFRAEAPESVFENADHVRVSVRREVTAPGEARVRVKTMDMTALAGVNFAEVNTVLAFAEGESGEKYVDIPIINDATRATNLQFAVTVSAETTNAVVEAGSLERIIQLFDGGNSISISSLGWGYEGYPNATLMVYRDGPTDNAASVELVTEGGSAIPGVDYVPITKTVQFEAAPGFFAQVIYVDVPLLNDDVADGTKTIGVKLQNAVGAELLSDTATVYINDDAYPFRFSETNFTAVQNQEYASVYVRPGGEYWDGGPFKAVDIAYKTEGGTAIPGVEYTPSEGSLHFEPSRKDAQEIRIPLLPNAIVGPDTTINVSISSLTPEIAITNAMATITLRHPPAIIAPGTVDLSFPGVLVPPTNQLVQLAVSKDFFYMQKLDVSAVPQITRMRRDGMIDPDYHLDFSGYSFLNMPNDELLLLGYGYPPLRLLRADGTLNESFQPEVPTGTRVDSAALTADSRLIVSGTVYLGPYADGLAYVRRLMPNGAIDPSFSAASIRPAPLVNQNQSVGVADIKTQADGRILIGGLFAQVNGARRLGIARLMPDGELDASFEVPTGLNFYVRRLAPLSNGKIYVGGYFPGSITLLNSDGSIDETFELPPNNDGWSHMFSLDSKERLYVISEAAANPAPIIRILPNGDVDSTFTADMPAWSVYPTSDGLYVLGPFNWGRTDVQRISRLQIDAPTMLRAPQLLSGNRIAHTFNFPANTTYVLEETVDFVSWSEVQSGVTANGYARVETAAPESTRFYRLRGK